jgi:hypothetical protein
MLLFLCSMINFKNKIMFFVWQVDLHLSIIEDSYVELAFLSSSRSIVIYGSEEDEADASDFLSKLHKDDKQLKDAVVLHLVKRFEDLPEVVVSHNSLRS